MRPLVWCITLPFRVPSAPAISRRRLFDVLR
jgi:hypothetical protein